MNDSETILHLSPNYPEGCRHEWVLPEGITDEESQQADWPLEVCSKCGMSLVRHIFTECP